MRGHHDGVLDLSWAPDGSALASGRVENDAVVYDVEAHRQLVSRGWG